MRFLVSPRVMRLLAFVALLAGALIWSHRGSGTSWRERMHAKIGNARVRHDHRCSVQGSATYSSTLDAPTRLPDDAFGFKCPKAPDSTTGYFHGQAYSDRGQKQCEKGEGMWLYDHTSAHRCIALTVGRKAELKPGDLVFDVGVGCGHKMRWMREEFGVGTSGVDLSSTSVQACIHASYVWHTRLTRFILTRVCFVWAVGTTGDPRRQALRRRCSRAIVGTVQHLRAGV